MNNTAEGMRGKISCPGGDFTPLGVFPKRHLWGSMLSFLRHPCTAFHSAEAGSHALGAVQPSLSSASDYLSSEFPQHKASVEMDSHLARTSSPQDSTGICKTHAARRLFSLSDIGDSLGGF